MGLKSTPFYTGFPTNVRDQSTYWSTVDQASLADATAKKLSINPQILSPGRDDDYRGTVIRIVGNVDNAIINWRVSSNAKHIEGGNWPMLLANGTATVGTAAVSTGPAFVDGVGSSITMNYCDTMTVTVSAYATAMQAMMDISNGINVYSGASNGIAELLIPDCFGTDLLIALQPNTADQTYVNYLARVIR